jgi:hypothetical protein
MNMRPKHAFLVHLLYSFTLMLRFAIFTIQYAAFIIQVFVMTSWTMPTSREVVMTSMSAHLTNSEECLPAA